MKRFIYFLLPLLLLVTAACGSDEPEEAGQIGCQAYYKDNKGVTSKTGADFFLYEGTGYTSIDIDTYQALPYKKMEAIKSNGERVENIGWCTCTKENSGLIVPTYSATDKDRLAKIQSGTFTIVCLTAQGFGGAYMMKSFTKKKGEAVPINATFWYSDYTSGENTKVPWR